MRLVVVVVLVLVLMLVMVLLVVVVVVVVVVVLLLLLLLRGDINQRGSWTPHQYIMSFFSLALSCVTIRVNFPQTKQCYWPKIDKLSLKLRYIASSDVYRSETSK